MLRRLLALLLHLIWPVSCPVCGRLGEVLCDECLPSLFQPALSRCLLCGGLFPCHRHPGAPRIRLASAYSETIKSVILAMKYGGFRALGPKLGEGMASLWPCPDADLLLPVPLHIESTRGYNQAFEIARGMGHAWGIEAADTARWSRYVPHRAGLGMKERLTLQADDFSISKELSGLRVALVDDVCTTGATLSRLAAACGAVGAVVVGAYAVASPSYPQFDAGIKEGA